MTLALVLGIAVTVASALALNWAYVQEHDAAAGMPPLRVRRPLQSARMLFRSRAWVAGAAGEFLGFVLYVGALALAPLSVVQTVSAGGIAVLSYLSNRRARRHASRRETVGVTISLLGLAGLGVSLADPPLNAPPAALAEVVAWVGGSAAIAVLAPLLGRRRLGLGVALAISSGVLFGAADVAMKAAFTGGHHLWLLAWCGIGYTSGTATMQIAYQHSRALTSAGITVLLTAALPIVAATTILNEGLPGGVLGAVRVAAFVAVIAGAVALARPDRSAARESEDELQAA